MFYEKAFKESLEWANSTNDYLQIVAAELCNIANELHEANRLNKILNAKAYKLNKLRLDNNGLVVDYEPIEKNIEE